MQKVAVENCLDLESAARMAAGGSYSPYSRFPVGAAVRVSDGRVFSACNVENASLGLSICAERAAVFQAVAAGCREIAAVVVYTPTASVVTPCGACRQVIAEFGPKALIVCICDSAERSETTLDSLLPAAFGAKLPGKAGD
jgi:cytidine deaminase